jgi:hypothetical protein
MIEHTPSPADSPKKDCGCGCGGGCGDKHEASESPADSPKKDCGCGCGGGDTHEASEPSNQGRRALIAGASSVVLIATLANRRAFGQPVGGAQCGPISHIGSLAPSTQGQQTGCGGLTPGFWKTHAVCTTAVLASVGATLDTTLGAVLTNLHLVSTCAAVTFRQALCNPSSDCSHWAGAILDALSPTMNPHYGYTLTSLNNAILTAFNQGVTGTAILNALKTLENDFGVNTAGCATVNITCPA